MKTLLILTKQPALSAAIQAVLDSARYQIVTKEEAWEAESLLSRGAIDTTILDLELTDVRAIRMIEEVKRAAPACPLLVYAGARQWEWEEDAYMLGVTHVLAKPVRAKLLNTLLERTFREQEKETSTVEAAPVVTRRAYHETDHVRALEALRHFSGVLTHSLNSEALLKQFLLLIREIVGVNRAVIFLRKPAGLLSESAHAQEDRWLRSACAIGLEQAFLEHFALSLGAGIGAALRRQGRILKAHSPEAQSNREIMKEFQLLGAEVAIPILDRETLIGVAVFDERLTGEPYANEELALIFHMLEEVGLAIRNSWLHDQLVANHSMVADILGTLGSGCVVIGTNLAVLHANAAAKRFFIAEKSGKTQLEFADLPQELGSRVFTVMKSGTSIAPFKYQFSGDKEVFYQVTISPFATQRSATPNAALLIIEDVTQNERAQRLEVESSNLRLVTSMAEHLAHEIGNTVVPISTHQQLMKERMHDPEFVESLSEALSSGVKRISRLASQMMFLARDKTDYGDKIRVSQLISEAFRDASAYQNSKTSKEPIAKESEPWMIEGDHKALRHAFTEVILNALQANPADPAIAVRIDEGDSVTGAGPHLRVEVTDSGSGFTSEAAQRAQEPFFSTRNVGLGIGLTVTRKIIEGHHGKVEIPPPEKGHSGVVSISLPLTAQE